MQLLYYDSNSDRQTKNSRLLKPALNGLVSLVDVLHPHDFLGFPGAERLILEGNYVGFLITALDFKYQGVLDTAILKQMEKGLEQHPNIILLGSKPSLENYVRDYGVKVIDAPNGYLQTHHLPQLIGAIQSIIPRQ